MEIIFIALFIISSQLIHSVAVDQQQGFNPYPFGTTICCLMIHPFLLVTSIFYMGWLWGIILFLCHLFGILHGTVSWVLDIPELLTTDEQKFFEILKLKISLLGPVIIANIIFTIATFFVSDFKSVIDFLDGNTNAIIVTAIIIAVLSVLRLIVSAKISKGYE